YAVRFYCCVWYKEILEDLQELEARYAESKRENLSEKEHRKNESRHMKKVKRAQAQKIFLIDLLGRQKGQAKKIREREIVTGITSESTVSLRTKAMRCLTQIIESDQSVLLM
ncbi:hypothetical protein TELCIR_23206, partial [Teladorsagia circumcincta]